MIEIAREPALLSLKALYHENIITYFHDVK
jgi:hypothetical protein